MGRGEGGGGGGFCFENRIINICFFTYCSLLGDLCTEIQMRLLLKKTHGGTFLEIQTDIYIYIYLAELMKTAPGANSRPQSLT